MLLTIAVLATACGGGSTASPQGEPLPGDRNGAFTTPADCALSAKLVPSCGVLWGGAVNPAWDRGEDWDSAFGLLASYSGRRLDVAHYYRTGDELFPDEKQLARHAAKNGPALFYFNWKPAPERTWREIADGAVDTRIDTEAAHLRATLRDPFFLTIQHEPEALVEDTAGSGMTAQDYDDMFRHVVERLRHDGVENAVTVMSYRGNAAWATRPWFEELWPGDDVVDWVAFDPYIFDNPDWDQNFPAALNRTTGGPEGWPGFYDWILRTHPGKPVMLGEWGISQHFDDATVKDRLASVRRSLPHLEDLKALIYWDSPEAPHVEATRMDDPERRRAFADLARSPEVVGRTPTPEARSGPEVRLRTTAD